MLAGDIILGVLLAFLIIIGIIWAVSGFMFVKELFDD